MKEQYYKKNSITLIGAIGLGTGVMIGAGIFALLGQVAELAGALFPISFLAGAVITLFSAYTYIKMSNTFPSAGGIGMFFVKAYGKGVITASASLMMALTMIINQSLVARTFGTYTLQLFNIGPGSYLVPVLGVGLLIFAFIVNISSNKFIGPFTSFMSLLKIIGIIIFAMSALWVAKFSVEGVTSGPVPDQATIGFIASLALTILAFKGFTTITNNGSEIVNPHKNVGRAIVFSILICFVIYFLVTWAVSSSLTISEIVKARDYSLAEAARPIVGDYGLYFTVGIAILATMTVIIASVFAVSRMTTMLTDMKLIPHRHFGLPGNVHHHMIVYIVVIAITLTIFFDLSRIASMGAILYLIMDILFHFGVLKNLMDEVKANRYIIMTAILLDGIVLGAFVWLKTMNDPLIVIFSIVFTVLIFIGEYVLLKKVKTEDNTSNEHSS